VTDSWRFADSLGERETSEGSKITAKPRLATEISVPSDRIPPTSKDNMLREMSKRLIRPKQYMRAIRHMLVTKGSSPHSMEH
jgi:hypothetical protein